jgi:hypothetical protein
VAASTKHKPATPRKRRRTATAEEAARFRARVKAERTARGTRAETRATPRPKKPPIQAGDHELLVQRGFADSLEDLAHDRKPLHRRKRAASKAGRLAQARARAAMARERERLRLVRVHGFFSIDGPETSPVTGIRLDAEKCSALVRSWAAGKPPRYPVVLSWQPRSGLPAGTVAGHIFDRGVHHIYVADDLSRLEVLRSIGHEAAHVRSAEQGAENNEHEAEAIGRMLARFHVDAVIAP